jgi:hypothetical protein
MLTSVAPLTLQTKELDPPGLTVSGFAVNEAMVGAEIVTVAVAFTVPEPLLAVRV